MFSGFRYGSDIVPFSKVDQEQMKYKHDGKCFAVLGFTKQNLVLFICRTQMVVESGNVQFMQT